LKIENDELRKIREADERLSKLEQLSYRYPTVLNARYAKKSLKTSDILNAKRACLVHIQKHRDTRTDH